MGSIGRKGMNSEAPAMLNILPKLALVVTKTYFSVLAKVVRPCKDALVQHIQVLLEQHEIGGFFGHIDRRLDRDAHIGACREGASLMPSPM